MEELSATERPARDKAALLVYQLSSTSQGPQIMLAG